MLFTPPAPLIGHSSGLSLVNGRLGGQADMRNNNTHGTFSGITLVSRHPGGWETCANCQHAKDSLTSASPFISLGFRTYPQPTLLCIDLAWLDILFVMVAS